MRCDFSSIGFYTFDCLGRPVARIPPNGETDLLDEITIAVSGAAGAAAVAARCYGFEILAAGGVGNDLMGDWVVERLNHFGVDTFGLQRCTGVGAGPIAATAW